MYFEIPVCSENSSEVIRDVSKKPQLSPYGSVRSAWYCEWLFSLVYILVSNSCSLILAPLQLSLHNQPSLLPVTPCLRRGLDQLRWYIVKTKVLFVMLQGEGYSDKLEDISE